MIAKIRIAKNRRRPICSRGIIAFMIDFRTTCKPGETQREAPGPCEQAPPSPAPNMSPERTRSPRGAGEGARAKEAGGRPTQRLVVIVKGTISPNILKHLKNHFSLENIFKAPSIEKYIFKVFDICYVT